MIMIDSATLYIAPYALEAFGSLHCTEGLSAIEVDYW